jgi:hypothetical protein
LLHITGIKDVATPASAVNLPQKYVPTAPPVAGSLHSIKPHILPDGKTGVVSDVFASTLLPFLIKVYRSTSAFLVPIQTTSTSSSMMSNPP